MGQSRDPSSMAYGRAPGLDDIAQLAEQALASIPAGFRRFIEGVALRVEEFPEDDVLADLELESPFDLLGLYRGVDLGHRDGAIVRDLDAIVLYRRPLLDEWCASEEDLYDLVRHVLIHEIGHHFGLSDEDMARIETEG